MDAVDGGDASGGVSALNPAQRITGRRGYRGKRSSASERPQRIKCDPRPLTTSRAWMQMEQRPLLMRRSLAQSQRLGCGGGGGIRTPADRYQPGLFSRQLRSTTPAPLHEGVYRIGRYLLVGGARCVRPPRYGCSAAGSFTLPSGCAPCSRSAARTRGTASPEPFNVCTSSGFSPCAVR